MSRRPHDMPVARYCLAVLTACMFLAGWTRADTAVFEFPPRFTRWVWTASAVDSETLYLDGGELWHSYYEQGYGETRSIFCLASTIYIDLTTSWTNSTVQLKYATKPADYPFARSETIWYNTPSKQVQAYGGWLYGEIFPWIWYGDGKDPPKGSKATHPGIIGKLWALSTDASTGEMTWTSNDPQPNNPINVFREPNSVATTEKLYSLGGWFNTQTEDETNEIAQPGLTIYDFQSQSWSNTSSSGYGSQGNGYAAWGEGLYTDQFGDEGVIIYIGGYTPNEQVFAFAQPGGFGLQDMSEINIYDIASKKFFTQKATGKIPQARWGFCAAGISEKGTGTFDIFIHGGFGGGIGGEPGSESLISVSVLSIPSFVWTEIPDSDATPRGGLTCEVIGQRQLVLVGGDNPTYVNHGEAFEPWTNCIGIYDMSAWQWASGYDAKAAPYSRNSVLTKQSQKTPYPSSWSSQTSQDIFDPSGKSNPKIKVQNSGGPKKDGSSGTNVGAIAGGIVGGILGLTLIIGAFILLLRRRRRNAVHQDSHDSEAPPYEVDGSMSCQEKVMAELHSENVHVELPTSPVNLELGPPLPWEIGGDDHPVRAELMGDLGSEPSVVSPSNEDDRKSNEISPESDESSRPVSSPGMPVSARSV